MADRQQQVRLAQAGIAVNKQRIVGSAGIFGNTDGGRVGKFIGIADDKVVKSVARHLRQHVLCFFAQLVIPDLVAGEHLQVEVLGEQIAQRLFDDAPIAGVDDVALEFAGAVEHQAVFIQADGRAVVKPGIHGGRRQFF